MKIDSWYSNNFETRLAGRYITLKHIEPLLKIYKSIFDISVIGTSEKGKEISLVKIGKGKKTVLAWSQMHGNETTTTKSIFDLLQFFSQKKVFQDKIKDFLENYTLYIIPMLNPDGALLYTRNNANCIDLNRDAKDLSQKESRLLFKVFKDVKPDLCLNLHGQRSIFGLENKKSASFSFLSPSSNLEREVTEPRKTAMRLIVDMTTNLQQYLPGKIGRYDDSFNANCFGDAFQMENVPVILFEAGQIANDYSREKIREYVFYSFLTLFEITNTKKGVMPYKNYFLIPENKKNFNDYVVRNIRLKEDEPPFSIVIRYSEVLYNGDITFIPKVENLGVLDTCYGHIEIDGKNEVVLVNSQSYVRIGDEISTIINKNDKSLFYFNKNNVYNVIS